MAGDAVKLLGFWRSPYSMRVKWALELKGIQYEYIEEDLSNKSPLLLQLNPVHKKIPVLIHDDKPVAESLVIIEYIDETWKHNPILPQDPYERAMARFWARFADEKCVPAVMSVFAKTGEEQEKAAVEARDALKTLETGLSGKKFFGGETIGYVDIAAGYIGYWVRIVEEILGMDLVEQGTLPALSAWFQGVLNTDVLKRALPPRDKLLEHSIGVRKQLLAAST